ncbi:MAG: SPASM domain-containing protein [Nitrospira sp.]|nr:SPASM domain-containing protein [bacterium]MBL7047990.1 SPASM domain-containing protein [Nitrospira sp.]
MFISAATLFSPLFIKRVLNYLIVQVSYRLAFQKVLGKPYVLIVDTVNICNLSCPLCPTGLNMPGRKKGKMDFATFKKVIDEQGEYAFTVVMHNWGEPLLNKDIFEMIAYAKKNSIKTVLSSNLNIMKESDAEQLITSGLDQLVISLDGVTPETYNQYRKGGDFQTVINNIKLLVRKKQEMGSSSPKLIWQFLVFQHNVHEVPEVEKLASELGVDGTDILSGQLGGPGQTPYLGGKDTSQLVSKWLLNDKKYMRDFNYFNEPAYLNPKRCDYLWKSMTVNWDGSVSPCCCVYEESTNFGNINQDSMKSIWNNQKFRDSRSLFKESSSGNFTGNTICKACRIFRKS